MPIRQLCKRILLDAVRKRTSIRERKWIFGNKRRINSAGKRLIAKAAEHENKIRSIKAAGASCRFFQMGAAMGVGRM